MSEIAHPIQHIRLIIASWEGGDAPPPDTAAWGVAWLRTWLAGVEAGRRTSLEIIGKLGAPGRPNWKSQQARRERDVALRELHRKYFPDLAPRAAARAILAMNPCPVSILISERQLANILR